MIEIWCGGGRDAGRVFFSYLCLTLQFVCGNVSGMKKNIEENKGCNVAEE
jgi:hypothetical protein